MDHNQATIAAGAVTAAIALWLMLPRGGAAGRMVGFALGLISLGLFASLGWRLGGLSYELVFWILSGVTLVAAGATITFRNPVYCAVWFALSLLGASGLFLLQGAQFLAVATIVVYAGAILVTFLFVLMLAQTRGQAYYDRLSWEPLLASVTGAVLVGVLTMAVVGAKLQDLNEPKSADLKQNILSGDHVATLGGELFSRHLIAVEVAGTLLLVALVGTIAMVSHQRDTSRQPLPGDRPVSLSQRVVGHESFPYAPSIQHAPPLVKSASAVAPAKEPTHE